MERNKNLGPLLIILFILVILVTGVVIRERRWPGLPWSFGLAPSNYTLLSEAVTGRALSDVPPRLVSVTTDTIIKRSVAYKLSKEGEADKTLITTTYGTKASISDLFAAYVDVFNDEGYKILDTKSGSGVAKIVAENQVHKIYLEMYLSGSTEKEVRIDVYPTTTQVIQ